MRVRRELETQMFEGNNGNTSENFLLKEVIYAKLTSP
jgi:hypothetical protein